jgi:hypothetical protein
MGSAGSGCVALMSVATQVSCMKVSSPVTTPPSFSWVMVPQSMRTGDASVQIVTISDVSEFFQLDQVMLTTDATPPPNSDPVGPESHFASVPIDEVNNIISDQTKSSKPLLAYLIPIIAVIVVVIILIIVILYVIYRRRKMRQVEIYLPGSTKPFLFHHELAPFFDPNHSGRLGWEDRESFSIKPLLPGNKDFMEMEALLSKSLSGSRLIDLDCITRAFAIYNPVLVNNFAAQRSILQQRIAKDPGVFFRNDWQKDNRASQRQFVKKHFDSLVKAASWNAGEVATPILPVVYGADAPMAWKIVETGFAALESLAAGWYGAGMYYTSDALYATPHMIPSNRPALLICLVNTGNPYPVVEDREDPKSLRGLPIKSGYQSNYVLTSKRGNVLNQSDKTEEIYNEIVIPQESQVIPVYLIELNEGSLSRISGEYQRVLSSKPVVHDRRETHLHSAVQLDHVKDVQ